MLKNYVYFRVGYPRQLVRYPSSKPDVDEWKDGGGYSGDGHGNDDEDQGSPSGQGGSGGGRVNERDGPGNDGRSHRNGSDPGGNDQSGSTDKGNRTGGYGGDGKGSYRHHLLNSLQDKDENEDPGSIMRKAGG